MGWYFQKKLPYDPASPLLGMYLKEVKAGTQVTICVCTQQHYLQWQKGKQQPKCTLADEWINKMWNIDQIEYYPS
jgi:hypothetical protein